MRILFVSSLYPSSVEPQRATYNRSLVLALTRLGHAVRVIAPVAWCPLIDSVMRRRRLPPVSEVLDGVSVAHPPIFYTPGLFIHWHYWFYHAGVRRMFIAALEEFRPDHVILGFLYPDAVALAPLCRSFSRGQASPAAGRAPTEPFAHESHENREMEENQESGTSAKETLLRPGIVCGDRDAIAIAVSACDARGPGSASLPGGVAGAAPLPTSGVPYAVLVLGSDFRIRVRQAKFRPLIMHCLHDAPIVLCPGQALKRDLIAAGVAPEKTVSFNNGFDPAVFFVPTEPSAHESHEIAGLDNEAGSGTNMTDSLPMPGVGCAVRNAQAFADSATNARGTKSEPSSDPATPGLQSAQRAGSGTLPGGVAGAAPLPSPYPTQILFVGNLLPVKGVDRLLHAWKRALPRLPAGARLLLVGDGPLRQPLQQLGRQLGITDTVTFLGRQPQTEIGALMRQSQLLVLPSRSEGMPNVVVEALACGIPVVATNVGEIPFLIRTGENGVVLLNGTDSTCLPPHAAVPVIEPLADAMVTALTAHWLPAGIARTVAGFSWDTAAAAVVNAFRGMKAEIGENRGSCPRNTLNQPIMHIRR